MRHGLFFPALLAALAALSGCRLSPLGASPESGPTEQIGGWSVHVSIAPGAIPGLAIRVGRPRPARTEGRGAWIEERVVLENIGHRTLRLQGTRSAAAMLGPPGHRTRLIATSGLCGFAFHGRRSGSSLVCLAMLDVTTLRPGAPHAVIVTLWQGGRGMESLAAGRYVFPFHFTLAGGAPSSRPATETVRLVYDVTAVQETARR